MASKKSREESKAEQETDKAADDPRNVDPRLSDGQPGKNTAPVRQSKYGTSLPEEIDDELEEMPER
jgi:hypothetical protein